MSKYYYTHDEIIAISNAAKKLNISKEEYMKAISVDVPPGAEAKLNELMAEAYEKCGITVTINQPELDKIASKIRSTLAQEVEELHIGSSLENIKLNEGEVGGPLECGIICSAVCAMTAGVGAAPAGSAAFVGGCVAVCALTEGLAAMIAGAA